MENLQLHAKANQDHFHVLKEKYQALRQLVKEYKALTDIQKETELTDLKTAFEKEKKEIKNNLY